ncbi:RNA-binding protein 12 [Caerostris extrusa]|uniref:RNA-binding protein 12 n=1 Tax=Caerostris extrusa TaxID=172846 RepID=A0AAV4UF37_CAEEX|nr:RNA-binding protein 12 [Caerostris extrusa]
MPPTKISSEVTDEIGKDISLNDEKCGVPPDAVEISGVPPDVTMKEILDLFPNIKIPAANICIIASYKDTEKVLIRFKHPNECEQVLNYQPYYIHNFHLVRCPKSFRDLPAIQPSPQPVSILQTPLNQEKAPSRASLISSSIRGRFEGYHPHPHTSEKIDFHSTFNGLYPTRGPHFFHGWSPGPGFPRGGCPV